MRRRAALALVAALTAAPALAQEPERFVSLDEAMRGATAMTSIGNGFIFIAKPDAAWICPINISSNHFVALIEGDDVVAQQTVPGAFCVPATHFKNLME